MKNIAAKLSLSTFAFVAACSIANSVFERGNKEGCMYYRGRVVPSVCVDEMVRAGVDGGFAFSSFSKCMVGKGREPINYTAPFVTESGAMEPKVACRFDGTSARNYYHFDGANRLYRRFISCRDGCHMVSDLHEITFEGELIFARGLAEIRE